MRFVFRRLLSRARRDRLGRRNRATSYVPDALPSDSLTAVWRTGWWLVATPFFFGDYGLLDTRWARLHVRRRQWPQLGSAMVCTATGETAVA